MIEPLLHAERLLLHGQVDAAERIYAQTVAADPNNAIAVVGLARVALERGDDMLAYRTACQALEIDSQNAAALRLEARLSEVLVTRGQPVERPTWIAGSGAPTKLGAPSPIEPAPSVDGAGSTDQQLDLSAQAERAALARNPSMADHRARMEQPRSPSAKEAGSQPARESASAREVEPRRRSVIARLLGRR